MQLFFRIMHGLRAGQGSADAVCPSSFIVELCTIFTAQDKIMPVFYWLYKVRELGKAPQMLSAPSSAIFEFCMEKVKRSFLNFARFAGWANLSRCYMVLPPSFEPCKFLTAQEKVMQSFTQYCKICELGKVPQMLSPPSSFIFELCKVFYCPRKNHARLLRVM